MNQHHVYGLVATNDLYSIYKKSDIEEVCGQFITQDDLHQLRVDPAYLSVDGDGANWGDLYAIVNKVKLVEQAKVHLETNKVFTWSIETPSYKFASLPYYNDTFGNYGLKYEKKKGGFILLPPPKDGPCSASYISTVKKRIVWNGTQHLSRTIGFNADFKTGTHSDLNGAAYVLKKLGLKIKEVTYLDHDWTRGEDGEYFRKVFTFDQYVDSFELMPKQRKSLITAINVWWKEASKLPTNTPL